jgi:hypothetical protein
MMITATTAGKGGAGRHRGGDAMRRLGRPRAWFIYTLRPTHRVARNAVSRALEGTKRVIARDPLFGCQDTRKPFAVSMFDTSATSQGPLFFIWLAPRCNINKIRKCGLKAKITTGIEPKGGDLLLANPIIQSRSTNFDFFADRRAVFR